MSTSPTAPELDAGGHRVPAAGTGRARAPWWAPLGLVCLFAAAYGQTLRFDLALDDHCLVIGNAFLWEQALYVAERSLYPALVGWCLFLAGGTHALVPRLARGVRRTRAVAWAMRAAWVGTFLAVTVVKVAAWRDEVTLWTAGAVLNPDSLEICLNLAPLAERQDRLAEAAGQWRRLANALPGHPGRQVLVQVRRPEAAGDRGAPGTP